MRFLTAFLATLFVTTAAQAHTGTGATAGLASGFLHPFAGLDHLLTMVGVGLLAAVLGGRALWLVPASFLAMMALGGLLALSGVALPFVETAIALSLVAVGLALASGISLPLIAALALAGGFAVFHGHAHGSEMPLAASGVIYGFGFLAATTLLHGIGIGAAAALDRLAGTARQRAVRLGGGLLSLSGLVLLAGPF